MALATQQQHRKLEDSRTLSSIFGEEKSSAWNWKVGTPLLPCKSTHQAPLSRFYIYALRYLFFSFWLTSLCMVGSRSIHVSANDTISFLYMANIPVYICITSFFNPFLCWWAFRLLPCPGYRIQWCSEYWGACISLNYGFLWVYA